MGGSSDDLYLLVVLEARPLLAAGVFAAVAAASITVSVEAAGRRLTGRRWAERRLRHPGKLPGHIRREKKSRRDEKKKRKERKAKIIHGKRKEQKRRE